MTVTARPTVIGLGELLWDVFPDSRRPGGAPANVAYHAQLLGCRGVVGARLGADAAGDELHTFLAGKGLDVSLIQRDAEHPTGTVTVSFENGQPRYVIHEQVAWDFLEPTPALLDAARTASAICFGTLAQRCPTSRKSLHAVLAAAGNTCLKVYDVNLRQNWYERDGVERSLHAATIVKLNDEEVGVLGALLGLPVDQRLFAQGLIDRYRVERVCITRGSAGCLLIGNGTIVDVSGEPVQVVDTVGAGDAFTAALIAAQLQGRDLHWAGRFANTVGGLVASRAGAMPDLADAYAALLAAGAT